MDNIKILKKFWKGKKVFITGHTGFKGSWMCILLNMLSSRIYGYSLKPKKISLFNQANCKKFIKKNYYENINDVKKLEKRINDVKPDILFHLAAQPLVSQSFIDPLETFNTNIIGTINVLNSVRKNKSLKSVVIITTDKVYKIKKTNKYYSEKDELGGKDPYSASKVCAEIVTLSYINSFFKKTNIKNKISTARSGNVIGGGDYSKNRLLPDIIKIINSKKIFKLRNPNHIRPWQHVIEPMLGYLNLAQSQYQQKTIHTNPNWNFGPNKKSFVKVIDIIKKIQKIKKIKVKIKTKQNFFETEILKLDSKKAKKFLKWYPKWDLNKSISNVIEWNDLFRKSKNAKKICEDQITNYLK